jgi:hypothetical protein
MSYSGPGTICGGLPVWATMDWSYDIYPGESDAKITEIRWLNRDGTPGGHIPQKVWDRAEKADPYFCCLTEALGEQYHEKHQRDPDQKRHDFAFDV